MAILTPILGGGCAMLTPTCVGGAAAIRAPRGGAMLRPSVRCASLRAGALRRCPPLVLTRPPSFRPDVYPTPRTPIARRLAPSRRSTVLCAASASPEPVWNFWVETGLVKRVSERLREKAEDSFTQKLVTETVDKLKLIVFLEIQMANLNSKLEAHMSYIRRTRDGYIGTTVETGQWYMRAYLCREHRLEHARVKSVEVFCKRYDDLLVLEAMLKRLNQQLISLEFEFVVLRSDLQALKEMMRSSVYIWRWN